MSKAGDAIKVIEGKLTANPDLAGTINAIFQFNIEGDEGGNWTLDLTSAPGTVTEGVNESADCAITMSVEDFEAMMNKTANPMQLYMGQKLKVAGNLPLSLKLQEIIK